MELNPLKSFKQLTADQARQAAKDFPRVRPDLWDFYYEIDRAGRVVDVYQKEKHATGYMAEAS